MKIQIDARFPESNLVGSISWKRLMNEELKRSGEIRSHENVTHIEVDEDGIKYYIRVNK